MGTCGGGAAAVEAGVAAHAPQGKYVKYAGRRPPAMGRRPGRVDMAGGNVEESAVFAEPKLRYQLEIQVASMKVLRQKLRR